MGIFGLRAVTIQSKSASKHFFFLMILFDVVYLTVQIYYMYMTMLQSKQGFLKDILGDYSLNAAVYYLIFASFALAFMTAKSYSFHILLCKLIAKLKSTQPINTGMEGF